ncbi:hypothetical protein J3U21_09750 [Gilliamella sp. B2776]|nr:hypothetical protein [Gilliamella sp. B2779]MCX8654273.1 hypothetical protein [Gilliamella sp. B2737]MCX8665546.1 hypothetical protein [Gilliamella sp. B2887]MCX8692434.1 hypothetical protein [Gilliamella sp. B2776]MCX8699256.1 hypothetical protein [Gilliamella sp. B3000]MCX8701125.1 hypothetical protein [Gilliamella sp. B2840]MCX8703592.1 hypothetical protein [Gilliamella sp. B2781]WDM19888.1 hypothetical protein J4T76_03605 [Gilliamella sp. B3022]
MFVRGDAEKVNSLIAVLNANYIDVLVFSNKMANQLFD